MSIVGLDGLIYACVSAQLLLSCMSRMPFDCESESELVVGLSMELSGILLGLFGFVEYGYVLAGCILLSCWCYNVTYSLLCVIWWCCMLRIKAVRWKLHQY